MKQHSASPSWRTLVLGCGSAGGGTATGGLKGRVMRGPTMPVCRVGVPCEEPARGVKLMFSRSGKVIGRATTNQKGYYRIALKSGRVLGPHRQPPLPEGALTLAGQRAQRPLQARRLPYRHRDSLADDQVDELPGDDDLLADLLAVQELLNPRRGLRLRDQLFL